MPINKNLILMYDFETNNINPYNCQPIEIAAVMIEPRNLEIIPGSLFYSLIKPIPDELCDSIDTYWNVIQDEPRKTIAKTDQKALDVNKKTLEQLSTAPCLKTVWHSFSEYILNYNPSKKSWNGPILAGFNNNGFDDIILNRISQKYGYFDEDRQQCSLFHPIINIDLMKMLFPWFESNAELDKFKMDTFRSFLGIYTENAHSADADVEDQAKILIQLMKLTRKYSRVTNWKK